MGKAIVGCLGLLASIATILTLLLVLGVIQNPFSPPPWGTGYTKIINRYSGLDLEVNGINPNPGGRVDLWGDLSQTNEEWKIVDNGGGSYKIVNRFSGLDLEDNNFNSSYGATVDQWTDLNQTNEEWTFQPIQ